MILKACNVMEVVQVYNFNANYCCTFTPFDLENPNTQADKTQQRKKTKPSIKPKPNLHPSPHINTFTFILPSAGNDFFLLEEICMWIKKSWKTLVIKLADSLLFLLTDPAFLAILTQWLQQHYWCIFHCCLKFSHLLCSDDVWSCHRSFRQLLFCNLSCCATDKK